MQTNASEYINQGIHKAAQAHNMGRSEVLDELERMAERARQYEATKSLTKYDPPPLEVNYLKTVENGTVQPYANDAEALKDLGVGTMRLVVVLAKPALAVVTVWGVCSVVASFFAGVAASASILGAASAWQTLAAIGLVILLCVGNLFGNDAKPAPNKADGKKRTFYQRQEQGYTEED